jgi:hypothetical protein
MESSSVLEMKRLQYQRREVYLLATVCVFSSDFEILGLSAPSTPALLFPQIVSETLHKAALTGSTARQKAKRRKTLTLCSNLEVAEGDGVGVEEVGDE